MCCSGVNVLPNQPCDVAFIYRENKDLTENQSGSAVKRMSGNGPMNMTQPLNESKKWPPHRHFSGTTTQKTS